MRLIKYFFGNTQKKLQALAIFIMLGAAWWVSFKSYIDKDMTLKGAWVCATIPTVIILAVFVWGTYQNSRGKQS